MQMDEQERDYLRQQIQELERSNRRWKLATSTLAAALAIFLIVGAVSSLQFGMGRLRQDRMMLEMERARAAEAEARLQAEQLRQVEAKASKEKKEAGRAVGIQEQANGDIRLKD
jgi:hypothetical protein